jgi:hypothetical protein
MEGGSSGAAAKGDQRLSYRVAIGLTLFAAALRVPTLSLRHLVEGDGVHYAQLARSILAADFSGLANPYWSNLWPAVIAATSWLTGLGSSPPAAWPPSSRACCWCPWPPPSPRASSARRWGG